MSANHTLIPSDLFKEMTEELDQLQSGQAATVAMKNALASAKQTFAQLNQGAQQLNQVISAARRQHLQTLHAIEGQNAQLHNQAVNQAAQLSDGIAKLQGQIQASMQQVQRIAQQVAAQYTSAEQLYQQVLVEFNIANLDPDYHRFAGGNMTQIASVLNQAASTQMSPMAKQGMLQSAYANLLVTDAVVTAGRINFQNILREALGLSSAMLAAAAGHRSNSCLFGQEKHPASDIDYWTDGQYSLMENELKTIRRRLEAAPTSPQYSTKQLQADLQRLKQLEEMQRLLAAKAIRSIKLSNLRRQQAQDLIKEILENNFYFEIVNEGFDRNDERESYILRMYRPADKAIVEAIVCPGADDGHVTTVIRVDSAAYTDPKLLNELENGILKDLAANDMKVLEHSPCVKENINLNAPVEVSDATRQRHSLPKRLKVKG